MGKPPTLCFCLLFVVILACQVEQEDENEPLPKSCFELPHNHQASLDLRQFVAEGEPIIIYGKVINQQTGETIPQAKLKVYQTDQDGNYNSSFFGMPSLAKIRGNLRSASNACYKISTIIPGNYPGEVDGKHIHVIATAPGYKKWNFEFLFEGWIKESLREEIKRNNDALILDLKEKENEIWKVEIDIPLVPS